MSGTLIVLRHGKQREDDWNIPEDDRPLSEDGERQMRVVAKIVKELSFPRESVRLLSSPILRAVQGAKIIGENIGVEPSLIELLGMGTQYSIPDYREQMTKLVMERPRGLTIVVTHANHVAEVFSISTGEKEPERIPGGTGFIVDDEGCRPFPLQR